VKIFDAQTQTLNVASFFSTPNLWASTLERRKHFRRPVSRASKIHVWASIFSVAQNPFPCSGCANQRGHPCIGARPMARPCCWPYVPSGPSTRLCRLVHGRACSRTLLFALPGLRLTCILHSIPSESYLSHQNLKVLPKSTDKPQCKHN